MHKWLSCALVMMLAIPGAVPGIAQSSAPYLAQGQVESIELIPPPPSPGSAWQRADFEAVLAAQASRTPALSARAQEDRANLTAFATVLGPMLSAQNVPQTAAFLAKMTREIGAHVDRVKDCWERPRPFVVSSDVKPLGTMADGMAIAPDQAPENDAPHDPSSPCQPVEKPAFSYSYPSGAASSGTAISILLVAMVPEKHGDLFARGWELGENRVIGGVHFPSDVEAGRTLATALIAVMMQNPVFRADLAAAKAELRAALSLPADRQ